MADSNITKKALADALKELMDTKPFHKISAQRHLRTMSDEPQELLLSL